jgi:CheY-like chemotaxis protein
MNIKEFANSAQGFTKSPLGIIALFIVLVYGFASIVVGFGQDLADHISPLIYFMVLFPVLVFMGFLWLVAKHHRKLYGPSDFKDEENFLKNQLSSAASLAAAIAKQTGDGGGLGESEVNEIVDLVSHTKKVTSPEKWMNRVLWVDDRPENNLYAQRALEAQGLKFESALSTNEALEILERKKFAVIISDMGRVEGPQEGYVLLEKLRKTGNSVPFIIFSASDRPEHRQMAREKGAIGSTNRVQELFQLVMEVVTSGT